MVRTVRFAVLSFVLAVLLFGSCIDVQDAFRSTELVSSQGEKIYINSLNWGMTHDYQYTVVTKERNRLKERNDTINGVKGLTPFVYKFSQDTLYLFFYKEKEITIEENFETVQLNYIPLDNKEYMDVLSKAVKGVNDYRMVP